MVTKIDTSDERAVRECFARSRVLIIGCGGLGSNIATMLVRSGVKSLVLVDDDIVDPANLNRQDFTREDIGTPKVAATKKRLLAIDPEAVIETHNTTATIELVHELSASCDVIVEAVDGAAFKEELIRAEELRTKTPLVMGLGVAGAGEANEIMTQQMGANLIICGDMGSDIRTTPLLLAPRVMLVAAHQALAVLRLLLGLSA